MRLVISLFALLATPVFANELSFHFGDDVVGFNLDADSPDGQASVQLGVMHEDDADINLYNAGLFANGERGRLTGRVGVKGYYADLDAFEGPGLAFGADLKLPMSDLLSAVAGFYFGPSATAFDDMDGYREWNIGVELKLFENSALELGIGDTEVELEDVSGDVDFQDGGYIRLKLLF